jgi:deoxyribonuclease V
VIACVDVAYGSAGSTAACVVAGAWTAAASRAEYTAHVADVAEYRPGEFYLRELPPILAVLARVKEPITTVVVDGYVWLDGARPALGARLHEALERRVAVIGVAKTAWRRSASSTPPRASDVHRPIAITRGASKTPLFVTSVGVDVEEAAAHVKSMHGAFRMPTLLKRADQLSRGR